MTLFREIIQNVGMNNPSEPVVVWLIRAGMVFAITEIWKVFIQKSDFSRNIGESMEKAKQKKSKKMEACKNKEVVIKAKRTVAKK